MDRLKIRASAACSSGRPGQGGDGIAHLVLSQIVSDFSHIPDIFGPHKRLVRAVRFSYGVKTLLSQEWKASTDSDFKHGK
jgi:hypothetical protein